MTTTAILIAAAILLTVLYTGIASWRHGELPESISALVYNLPRGWQFVWTCWLWAAAFLTLPGLLEATPEPFKGLAFLTCVLLAFTGATPLVAGSRNQTHYALAISAGVASQICVAAINWHWLIAWAIPVILHGMATTPGARKIPRWLEGKGVTVVEFICSATTWGAAITH